MVYHLRRTQKENLNGCIVARRMKTKIISFLFILFLLTLSGCSEKENITVDRQSKIPSGAVKMSPLTDTIPPILHSTEFEEPVPFDAINTAGAEDSPFIPADRDEIYFFFTPDVKVPIEKQLLDGVTGIYVSKKVEDSWGKPERVWLQDPGKLSLDGCEFVLGDKILFCTAREGYVGLHWATAERKEGKWGGWKVTDFEEDYNVGELHITADGNELYFHSNREGGKGDNDIWVSEKVNGEWTEPKNIEILNTEVNEGMPYITPDGKELWFNRWYKGTPAVFRSKKVGDEWGAPELIVSMFAGEPTLDKDGNLYFVHHYYKDNEMIEADIYVAYKK